MIFSVLLEISNIINKDKCETVICHKININNRFIVIMLMFLRPWSAMLDKMIGCTLLLEYIGD